MKRRRTQREARRGGSGCPGPPLHPPPGQTSSLTPRNGSRLPGAWAALARRSPHLQRCHMYKGKKAAASTGDQERRPGLGSVGGVSPVCAPPGLSHRSRGTLAGLGVFPSDCPGARTRQAAPRGPQGHGQGSRSQSAARGGPARGPLPPQFLLCFFPRSSGSEGGRPRWSPDPSFPSQAARQDAGGR